MGSLSLTGVLGSYCDPVALKATIQSICVEEDYFFEQIRVIDDTPADHATFDQIGEVLSEFEFWAETRGNKIIVTRNLCRVGVPAVFSQWLRNIDSDYYIFLSQGDRLSTAGLKNLISFALRHPEVPVIHGRQLRDDGVLMDDLGPVEAIIPSREYLLSQLGLGSCQYGWSQMAAIIKTNCLNNWFTGVKKQWFWDTGYQLDLMSKADTVGYVPHTVTYREKNLSSAWNSVLETKIGLCIQVIEFLEKDYTYLYLHNRQNFPIIRAYVKNLMFALFYVFLERRGGANMKAWIFILPRLILAPFILFVSVFSLLIANAVHFFRVSTKAIKKSG